MHHENPDVSINNSAILEGFLDSPQFPCSPTAFIRLPQNWLVWGKSVNLSFPGFLMILSDTFWVISTDRCFHIDHHITETDNCKPKGDYFWTFLRRHLGWGCLPIFQGYNK